MTVSMSLFMMKKNKFMDNYDSIKESFHDESVKQNSE